MKNLLRGKNGKYEDKPVGSTRIKNGYKLVKFESGLWRYEHREIIEQLLGRRLWCGEMVHHLDGNRLNNDITNLRLVNHREHNFYHDQAKGVTRLHKGDRPPGLTPRSHTARPER